MISRIRVYAQEVDTRGQSILHEIQNTGCTAVTALTTAKIYYVYGLSAQEADFIARTVLHDPLTEQYQIDPVPTSQPAHMLEIAPKPGVMNPEIATLFKAARDLRLDHLNGVQTSYEYQFHGAITREEIEQLGARFLMNSTIEYSITTAPQLVPGSSSAVHAQLIPIRNLTSEELRNLALNKQWYFSDHELQHVQNYFIQQERDPFDIEIETIAQTWSEHCYHKTFKSPLLINGIVHEPLFTRLKAAAHLYAHQVISAFADNAGVFRFYDHYGISGKVETHNSPSAIEPYGGAATGSGGVFRDIMGTGQGARVIASTDIFCFAPPDIEKSLVPAGCLAPDYLLRKVVAGVRDYANRMGIPTINGSVHFHENFRAKPTVIVGAYGIAPESFCYKKNPAPGDLIVLIGGATGRDGIHGATFSSNMMQEDTLITHAQAVQIGNAIEEKRLADLIIAARDKNLIQTITDCGAGGLSSAIGEMASSCGALVELEKVPLKYVPLTPWEIWISESQERMVCALKVEDLEAFFKLCLHYNVPVATIGRFTNSNQLIITYQGAVVCDLSLQFLHNEIPLQTLEGSFAAPALQACDNMQPTALAEIILGVLAEWNVCSKEPIIRQYDHSVQGASANAPYQGVHQTGPSDAAILTPLLGKPYGLIISHGLNPLLMERDIDKASWWAVVEALSNLVAVGGCVQDTCLIDNFIWPQPNTPHLIGSLNAALEVCVQAMHLFKIPFISGKDSLSSTYRFSDGTRLDIPPVLCISAFGKIPDVAKTISSDFKTLDSCILLIGKQDFASLGGSIYLRVTKQDQPHFAIPDVRINNLPHIFSVLHALINDDVILACHDISEGGLITTLAEMCFGGDVGATLDISFLDTLRTDFFLFNETAGCFLIEVSQEMLSHPLLATIEHRIIGRTSAEKKILINKQHECLVELELSCMQEAAQKPLKEVFS